MTKLPQSLLTGLKRRFVLPASPEAQAAAPAHAEPEAEGDRPHGRAGKRAMTRRIEDFALIIGAMKAGTTTLFEYLGTHPEIAPCGVKEPNFFSRVSISAKGPDYYAGLWPGFDPARHRYALEASPNYTKYPRYRNAPSRISAFDARFRFLYILRDPVDRIESHIAHNIARGRLSLEDYPQGFLHALPVSRYVRQLDAYHAAFRDPEILLLDFDRLRREPAALLSDCLRFLELGPGFAFTPRPPANVRAAANGSESFRLTPEERLELQGALYDDVMQLGDRYGFDVSGWNFPQTAPPRTRRFLSAAAPAPVRGRRSVPPKAAAAPARRRRPAGAQSRSHYWAKRQDMMYYKYVLAIAARLAGKSQSLIDVGSNRTSIAEAFDWIPRRHALDLREPYSSAQVVGIRADFLEFQPEERYDFALCLQVLEHIPEAERFARKLLATADRVLVSVPYRWPEGACRTHCQDPVDEAKLSAWFGREPDYRLVVEEPFVSNGKGRRLIAYFHAPGQPFRLQDFRNRLRRAANRPAGRELVRLMPRAPELT